MSFIQATKIATMKKLSYHLLQFMLYLGLLSVAPSSLAQKSQYHSQHNGRETRISYEGQISLNREATDIIAMEPGAYLEYQVNREKIIIKADRQGQISRSYFRKNREMPYEPDGRLFFENYFPELIRNSAIGAETRVKAIYQEEGLQAILSEIRTLESDYVRYIYYKKLVEQALKSSAELKPVLNTVRETFDSDYYHAKLLLGILSENKPTPEIVQIMLQNAQEIKSDYEQQKVLSRLVENKALLANDPNLFFQVLDGIHSDYYQARTLHKMIDQHIDDPQMNNLILAATDKLNSNYEASKILQKIAQAITLDAGQWEAFCQKASRLSSDYEKKKIALSILANNRLAQEPAAFKSFFCLVEDIHSDYEQAQSILNFLNTYGNDEASISQIIQISTQISSDYEQARVLLKLSEKTLHVDQIMAYLQASKSIGSNYEKARVLTKLTDKQNLQDEKVKELYREVASTISSDYEYGKVMRALD